MTNDQLEKILSGIRAIKQKMVIIKPTLGLKIVLVGFLLLVISYNLFFVYVQPDEYGIKVVRLGLNRGVQKEVYHAGLSFVLPFGFQQMYRLPKGIQVLELTNFPETAASMARKDRAVRPS
jgi:uncharacterized membrane protein YqiK